MNIKKSKDVLVKKKPIPLRLAQHELDDAEKISATYEISKSVVARRAYRLGLPILKKRLAGGKS